MRQYRTKDKKKLKKIVGYERYYVNENGEVFSVKKNSTIKICQWLSTTGYYKVCLHKNNTKHEHYVHRLVAQAFVPNPNNLPQVMHKNDIKTDCRAENLAWGTNQQNTADGYKHGCYKFKERCHKVQAVHKITGETLVFNSIRQCAEYLGYNRKCLTMVLKKERNNNYDYEFSYLMRND